MIPQILDHRGNAITASSYGGQDRSDRELQRWQPMIQAPDDAVLSDWEQTNGRLHDLVKTNGIASGAVQTLLDQIIGPQLKLVAKPDWRALGLTKEWAAEWEREVEADWRNFAYDLEFRCHAARTLDVTGMVTQGMRSYLTSSEILATAEWMERPGWSYRTAIQPVDPERMSTPDGMMETPRLRAGVAKDRHGAPIGHHIRESHPNDMLDMAGARRWKYVPRETSWGRQMVIHIFDQHRSGQTRGQNGMLAGIKPLKMLERWQGTSLQAAIINAMYAATIETGMDNPAVLEALGCGGQSPLTAYLAEATEFHKGTNKIQWDGSKIAHLFPGEKLNLLSAQHPVAAFEQFEAAALRHIAASWNMSYEQLSKDYSRTNYSSARASMLEAWKFIISRRHHIAGRMATAIYALWLEDAIDAGTVELPKNGPGFYEPGAKRAYTQCTWIGPAREHIDPLKGAKSAEVEYQLGITTLEQLCADKGLDWEEVVEQRAHERKIMIANGLDPDHAMGIVMTRRNQDVEDKNDDPDESDNRENRGEDE